jgi:peptidoglycan hydrolase-like protein with peptidoglycan-binding domain
MRKNSSSIRIRTLAAAAALALSVVPVALATPATADVGVAAASCTGNSTMTRHGLRFTLPSVGNNTGNLNCHLGRGNQSVAVSNLQAHLNLCYWSGSTMSGHRSVFSTRLATDGIFGDRTRNAVIAVQGHHRISADGSYGPQTRGVMFFAADNGGAGVCRQYGA